MCGIVSAISRASAALRGGPRESSVAKFGPSKEVECDPRLPGAHYALRGRAVPGAFGRSNATAREGPFWTAMAPDTGRRRAPDGTAQSWARIAEAAIGRA